MWGRERSPLRLSGKEPHHVGTGQAAWNKDLRLPVRLDDAPRYWSPIVVSRAAHPDQTGCGTAALRKSPPNEQTPILVTGVCQRPEL